MYSSGIRMPLRSSWSNEGLLTMKVNYRNTTTRVERHTLLTIRELLPVCPSPNCLLVDALSWAASVSGVQYGHSRLPR